MPPTPASPTPCTAPVFADDRIEVQCLVLARDHNFKAHSKTGCTQQTAHAQEALVGRMGEQEGGKEDEEDAKC